MKAAEAAGHAASNAKGHGPVTWLVVLLRAYESHHLFPNNPQNMGISGFLFFVGGSFISFWICFCWVMFVDSSMGFITVKPTTIWENIFGAFSYHLKQI